MENSGIRTDYTYYPGEDLYSDGAVEDELLDIVKTAAPSQYKSIIEEKAQWPVLYHLSSLRENTVSWVPVEKGSKILEVGSGCGAITGALAKKAGELTCIELSEKRSLINAGRHPELSNTTIILGNFQTVEPNLDTDYDYIFLIGVFEYAQSYIGGDSPYEEFLNILKKHVRPGGRIIIAIENKLGLKYWAGCREDHLATFFEGIEGYPNGGYVRTFSKKGLEKICKACGISEYSFYYPYPDYKFMTTLFSDRRLPRRGELTDNMRNFDRSRLLLFDEKNVFDTLIEEGLFDIYSNSYVLVTGPGFDTEYVRYSNDRDDAYAISTELVRREEKPVIIKRALTEAAVAHVEKLKETCEALSSAYEGFGLKVNRCTAGDGFAEFEYLEGKTLEEVMDDYLLKGDTEGFESCLERFEVLVRKCMETPPYNLDFIFSNIMVCGEEWTLIDYEWVTEEKQSADRVIARALMCYGYGSAKRREISMKYLKEHCGLSDKDIPALAEEEQQFQDKITGGRMSMTSVRNTIDNPIIPAAQLAHSYMEKDHRNRVQIYEDHGEGFSEDNSYFTNRAYDSRKPVKIKLELNKTIKNLRIDPAMDYCIVRIIRLEAEGRSLALSDRRLSFNGKKLSADTVLFDTQDPGFTIRLDNVTPVSGKIRVEAEFEAVRLSETMARSMSEVSGKKGFAFFRG